MSTSNLKANIQELINQNKRNLDQLRDRVKDEQYKIKMMTNSPTNKGAKEYHRETIRRLKQQMEPIKARIKELQAQKKML